MDYPVALHPTGGNGLGWRRNLPDTHIFNSPAVKIVLNPACQRARPTREPLILVCDYVLILLPSCKLNWEVRDEVETEIWNKAIDFFKSLYVISVSINVILPYPKLYSKKRWTYITRNTQKYMNNGELMSLKDDKSETMLWCLLSNHCSLETEDLVVFFVTKEMVTSHFEVYSLKQISCASRATTGNNFSVNCTNCELPIMMHI